MSTPRLYAWCRRCDKVFHGKRAYNKHLKTCINKTKDVSTRNK